jgi:hypothetical protein
MTRFRRAETKFRPGVVLQWPSRRVDVLLGQAPLQKEIVVQINMADRDVVGGTPVGVDLVSILTTG